ncbi:MAG: Holliday junction branch migration protein RuvA [Bacteriovoracaceae bacterium]
MIGFLSGTVLFSDGHEVILSTNSGVGYQIYFNRVLREGSRATLYISHVIKEASEELYGFLTLRDKKLFELLNSVKGVGPKSAATLIASVGTDKVVEAVLLENKKTLTKAPGIGPKAAAQILLDLSTKIVKVKGYSNMPMEYARPSTFEEGEIVQNTIMSEAEVVVQSHIQEHPPLNQSAYDETLMACKELGFKEEQIAPLAQKLMNEHSIEKSEQLLHLVLKEI